MIRLVRKQARLIRLREIGFYINDEKTDKEKLKKTRRQTLGRQGKRKRVLRSDLRE